MRGFWLVALVSAVLLVATLGIIRMGRRAVVAHRASGGESPPLAHSDLATPRPEPPDEALHEPEAPYVAGLDLLHITTEAGNLVAPADGGTAHLTLEPDLQRTAIALMKAHAVPEGAVVLMEVATGRLVVYASHLDHGPMRDLCTEATAPSASVFKIVTAAALVEDAHLGAATRQCYSGGEQRIGALDLVEDPQRDRWCTTLAGALGRSINTVFARLANERLTPSELDAMAHRFGYGENFPFDVPVQPSTVRIPSERLDFARTAAGFWNSTLSPIEAAEMSAIVARGGETVRPVLVDHVTKSADAQPRSRATEANVSTPSHAPSRRVIARGTAEELTAMMSRTVIEGTSYRAFHDARGSTFLPGVTVAGKTGTLSDPQAQRYYTWFTGFAHTQAAQSDDQVAVAVLVVNGPVWTVKANVIAREVLRAYFAAHAVAGITRPSTATVARHKHPQ